MDNSPNPTLLTARFHQALEFASRLHADQIRKGTDIPYIAHLLAVTALVLEHGADEEVAIAALLHDAAEDQGGITILQEIQRIFGRRVSTLVEACSDTLEAHKPPWKERKARYLKHLATASDDVLLIAMADKLHNARAVLNDFRKHGDGVWARFQGGKQGTLWYYEALATAFADLGKHPDLTRELTVVVGEMLTLARAQKGAMRLADLGEFGIIDRIRGFLPAASSDVVVGIGDDVAVLDTGGPHYLLATCDIQVENVHFLRDTISPHQLGRKVIAINVSDIAAMGGRPKWALVSLGLPPDLQVDFIDELYRGLKAQAQAVGIAIVGGNLSQIHGPMVIDLFLLGECARDRLLRRDGAQVGDAVMVTGELGDSRAGLELLLRPHLQVLEETRSRVLAAHLTPQPRLAEGQLLAASNRVHAMLDVSDGILSDLGHICEASRVGSTLELARIPISRACHDVARAAGGNPEDWALTGGEDYQLLFVVPPGDEAAIQELLSAGTGAMATVIGRIQPAGSGITLIRPDGTAKLLAGNGGWNHFKQGAKS